MTAGSPHFKSLDLWQTCARLMTPWWHACPKNLL